MRRYSKACKSKFLLHLVDFHSTSRTNWSFLCSAKRYGQFSFDNFSQCTAAALEVLISCITKFVIIRNPR